MRVLYYVTLCCLLGSTIDAEPSVYGNSNGFAAPQQIMAQNQKRIGMLAQQIAEQKEQIDGLKSIVEGLSATVHELAQDKANGTVQNASDESTTLLHELGAMIDKINSNYVTKEELHNAVGGKHGSVKAESQSSGTTIVQTPAEAYSEGVRLFVKHRYDEAKKRFTFTDKKGYKAAPSNYYLGEIAYYTKKYEDAIFFYKKSAGLNDKTSYIDTLLLHTAISLEYRGEKDQAKIFYENIIANYAGKKTASIAQQKLKKL